MILQSLVEYYDRKAELGEIAPLGFEEKGIPFLIKIDREGRFKDLVDTREIEPDGKKPVARKFMVPNARTRPGSNAWMITNFLWDHAGYILGHPKGDAPKDRQKRYKLFETASEGCPVDGIEKDKLLSRMTASDIDCFMECLQPLSDTKEKNDLIKNLTALKKAIIDGEKQLGTFVASLEKLPPETKCRDEIQAVKKFYTSKEYLKVFHHRNWEECAVVPGANLTFQIEGDPEILLRKPYLVSQQQELSSSPETESASKDLCLVSGDLDYIERIHKPTPILGGQAAGKLVGFQKNSGFDSYGKEQAFNAPVGRRSQIAYSTALNTLIKSKNNHVNLGDTTIVFWSEKGSSLEKDIPFFLAKSKDDPDRNVQAVKQLYESIASGKVSEEEKQRFYVLGLAPNAARVSVRYWITGTVGDFSDNIRRHFDDLEIVRGNKDSEFFALNTLLSHTVLEYKLDNVAPNVAGQVTEAVLRNTPYPKSLYHAAIRRIRAEQHITRVRAAILKACINRNNRFYHNEKEDITVALDVENRNPAYRLGRLFAVLENLQSRALNVETIRERYYGAFSSTPVTVFPQLMKLRNHHLAKLERGGRFYFEKLIGEILDGLDGAESVPRQFSLDEQGRFAIGYYHQRQDLFRKKEDKSTEEAANE